MQRLFYRLRGASTPADGRTAPPTSIHPYPTARAQADPAATPRSHPYGTRVPVSVLSAPVRTSPTPRRHREPRDCRLEMGKWRRHVFLAVHNCGAYPIRRINTSTLFHPANQARKVAGAGAAAATAMPPAAAAEEAPLPRPCVSFRPACPPNGFGTGSLDLFGLFGRGDKKTLLAAVNDRGVSHTYDVDDRVVSEVASPREPKLFQPVTVALGDALYVLDRRLVSGRRGCCFEALTFGHPEGCRSASPRWQWSALQPPPFMSEPGYQTTNVDACTVDGGGSGILISMSSGIGTYSFDTASGSWAKVGDWVLPFLGPADFLPEYGAWLGFSAADGRLCYSPDLGASMECRPVSDTVWCEWDHPDSSQQGLHDPDDPERYTRVLKLQLVHLGRGKFCVARFMETVENEMTDHGIIPQIERFAVLTGLVLKPSKFGKGIDMVPHKSVLYKFEGTSQCWVF